MSKINIGCKLLEKMFPTDIVLKTHIVIAHQKDNVNLSLKGVDKSLINSEAAKGGLETLEH